MIFRIGIFYCGSILLLVSMLPTTEYTAGTSPFVTVFERLGLPWMSALIQAILIVAAMSSLNSGPVLDRAGAAQPRGVQAGPRRSP